MGLKHTSFRINIVYLYRTVVYVAEALAIEGLFTNLSNQGKILNDNEQDIRRNKSKATNRK